MRCLDSLIITADRMPVAMYFKEISLALLLNRWRYRGDKNEALSGGSVCTRREITPILGAFARIGEGMRIMKNACILQYLFLSRIEVRSSQSDINLWLYAHNIIYAKEILEA